MRATIQEHSPRHLPWKHEGWHVEIEGQRLNSFEYSEMYDRIIGHEIRQHWMTRHDIAADEWDQIYWEGVEKAVKSLPRHITQWSSKHLAGFSPTAKVMKRRKDWQSDKCPICDQETETAEHLWRCNHEKALHAQATGKATFIHEMEKQRTSPHLLHLFRLLFKHFPHTIPQSSLNNQQHELLEAQSQIGIAN